MFTVFKASCQNIWYHKQRKNLCDDFNEVELTTHFRLAKTTAQKLLKTETAVTD